MFLFPIPLILIFCVTNGLYRNVEINVAIFVVRVAPVLLAHRRYHTHCTGCWTSKRTRGSRIVARLTLGIVRMARHVPMYSCLVESTQRRSNEKLPFLETA
jgi:hypothetical protein